MGEDGWAFDVLKGFGDYDSSDNRRTESRRNEYDDAEHQYEDEYDEEE
jgi:hypothetical protein